jgi:hypothetical protein
MKSSTCCDRKGGVLVGWNLQIKLGEYDEGGEQSGLTSWENVHQIMLLICSIY